MVEEIIFCHVSLLTSEEIFCLNKSCSKSILLYFDSLKRMLLSLFYYIFLSATRRRRD